MAGLGSTISCTNTDIPASGGSHRDAALIATHHSVCWALLRRVLNAQGFQHVLVDQVELRFVVKHFSHHLDDALGTEARTLQLVLAHADALQVRIEVLDGDDAMFMALIKILDEQRHRVVGHDVVAAHGFAVLDPRVEAASRRNCEVVIVITLGGELEVQGGSSLHCVSTLLSRGECSDKRQPQILIIK